MRRTQSSAVPSESERSLASAWGARVAELERELTVLAARTLRSRRGAQPLHTATLVQETCLRLLSQRERHARGHAELLGLAAEIMRRILADQARARARLKRPPAAARIELEEGVCADPGPAALDVLAVDELLDELAALDREQARLATLRIFGGLASAECASALGIPLSRARTQWRTARAWLRTRLSAR